jgi:predicted DNA binding protein
MMEAVVSLKIPQNWMSEIPEKHPVTIKVIERVPYSDKGVKDLVEIAGPEEVMADVLKDIKKNPLVSKVDTTVTDKGKVIGAVTTSRCDICRILTDSDVFLISAESRGEGKVEWTLILTDKDVLKGIFEDLGSKGVKAELIKLTKIDDKETLTDRQDKITHVAFERGYFDYPKRISLRELAKMFDVSPSTLSEILRKGQRKIVLDYFKKQRQTI